MPTWMRKVQLLLVVIHAAIASPPPPPPCGAISFTSASQTSTPNSNFGASKAIDGSTSTRQGANGGVWTGDLGVQVSLTEVTIVWEACACTQARSMIIEVSADNTNWVRFGTQGGFNRWGYGSTKRTTKRSNFGSYRYVRVYAASSYSSDNDPLQRNQRWWSMWEIRARAACLPPSPPPPLSLIHI